MNSYKSLNPFFQILRLYAQYRQAEIHRKGLVFQKHYLQCHLDAFYQTQQVALSMLADMGCVVSHESSFPPPSRYPRPYARFRAVGAAVRAVFRFRYMCRRKREYLQSKTEKLDPTGKITASSSEGTILVSSSLPKVTFSAPLASELGRSIGQSASSEIGMVTGIPTAVSNIGIRSGSHSRTRMGQDYYGHGKGDPSTGSAKLSTKRSPKSRQHTSIPKFVAKRPSSEAIIGGEAGTSASHLATSKPSSMSLYGPQLTEYMEGLERYQSRLSKTKPSPPHTTT